jgi:hypothetical protein
LVKQLLGPFLALLPRRWRAAAVGHTPINWPRAAFLSGMLEAFGCLLGLIGWYLFAMQKNVDAQMDVTLKATNSVPGEGSAYAMGFAAFVLFAIHPLTWLLAYFSVEGVLRAFAAALNEEVTGTLTLVLVDWLAARVQRAAYERRFPRVPDLVTRGDGKQPWDLQVASSRRKPHWKYPLTICFGGEFFQVIGETSSEAAVGRPHAYLLRRLPPGEVLRGLEHYSPEASAGDDSLPGYFESISRSWRERYWAWRLPLIRDELQYREDPEGCRLEVRSCRPKRDWNETQLVLYDGRYYRFEGEFYADPPRPFGYLLRRLPAGVPGHNVRHYSPDEIVRAAR